MARSVLRKDFDLGTRIIDLQRSNLLKELSPEKIATLAKYTRSLNLELKDSKKTINSISTYCGFIAAGTFDEVYISSENSDQEISNIVSLRDLSIGDFWGEYTLSNDIEKVADKIKLRLLSDSGRLIYIPVLLMKQILDNYPSVQTALLNSALRNGFENTINLGEATNELADRNFILNRIDSVGKVLSGMLEKIHDPMSSKELKQQIQVKYLLSQIPNLSNLHCKKVYLEQAYLPHEHEDRIRSINNETFLRTIKLGKGKIRSTQEYKISSREFRQLQDEMIEGSNLIKKYRYTLDTGNKNSVITIDEFLGEGNLKGLTLAEINYPDDETYQKQKDFIPDWLNKVVIERVTSNTCYSNFSLATNGKPI